jgi:hypothetical protein
MAVKVGDRVECWSKDEGFLDSFFEADLQSISGKRCFVKYVELLTEDGDRLIENIPMDQLRPLPPKIDKPGEDSNFPPGHSIEAYHKVKSEQSVILIAFRCLGCCTIRSHQ